MQRRKAIFLFLGLLGAAGVVLGLSATGLVNFQALDKLSPQARKLLFPDGGLSLPSLALPSSDAGTPAKVAAADGGLKLKLAPGEEVPRGEAARSPGLLGEAMALAQSTCTLTGKVTLTGEKGPLDAAGKVIVYVEEVPGDAWQRESHSAQLTAHKGRLEPALLAVLKDDTLRFLNPEGGEHALFSASGANTFALNQGKQTLLGAQVLGYRGAVHLQDDLDEGVSADVMVVGNPFFALAGPGGSFKLDGVPKGDRNVMAWEPNGGSANVVVKCSGDTPVPPLAIEQLAPSPRKHRDGKPYR